MSNNRTRYIIASAILLLAAGLRLYRIAYGVVEPCLTVPEEYWLWDNPQVASLYSWDVHPVVVETILDPHLRTAVTDLYTYFFLRLVGVFSGLVTVAVMMRLAIDLRSNWWLLAGLVIAVAPPLVVAEHWLVRFNWAPLAISVSSLASYRLRHQPIAHWLGWLSSISALSLLLIAPPLWWMTLALLALQPAFSWRRAVFVLIIGISIAPVLRSPEHWLSAVFQWDSGTTAGCIIAVLALALWRWRTLSPLMRGVLGTLSVVIGLISLALFYALPSPTADQWALIRRLQERIPDGAAVQFDSATWVLNSVVACPRDKNIQFTALATPYSLVFLPGVRLPPPVPDYVVTTSRSDADKLFIFANVDDKFLIARTFSPGNAVDIGFGDLLYLLNYQVTNSKIKPGDLLDIRLDYQFTSKVTIDSLRYAAFIQVVPADDLGNKLINYNVPIVQESGNFGPRRVVLNQHHRLSVPNDARPGKYKIFFGLYNIYTGERLKSSGGDMLALGDIEIGSP